MFSTPSVLGWLLCQAFVYIARPTLLHDSPRVQPHALRRVTKFHLRGPKLSVRRRGWRAATTEHLHATERKHLRRQLAARSTVRQPPRPLRGHASPLKA